MPRIFDCLLLDGELGELEVRFRTLGDIPGVTHVIVEAPVTSDGKPKPLHFWENRKDRFAGWHGRWTHVRVEPHEITGDTPAAREASLRDYLAHGISGGPDDIILHGPAASIPDPGTVRSLAAGTFAPPVTAGTVIARHWRDVNGFADLEEFRQRCT